MNTDRRHLLSNGQIPAPLASADGDELVAFENSMKVANGVFNNQFAGATVPAGSKVRSDDLRDGLSHTVLFSENLQAVPWHHVRVQEQHSAAALTPAAGDEDVAPSESPPDVAYPFGEPRFLQGIRLALAGRRSGGAALRAGTIKRDGRSLR